MSRRAQTFSAAWERFASLNQTQDSLSLERRSLRRWFLLPYLAFVIPIEDSVSLAQIAAWQPAFRPWLRYDPQPPERLHITLHSVGLLRQRPWMLLPHTWRRTALPRLAARVGEEIRQCPAFDVEIGPLNAFPNVLIAEVQDDQECLRRLRAKIRRALPLRARPPSEWDYLPHVTLGFWGAQPTAPLVEALRPYRTITPLPFRVERVWLTIYTRGAFLSQDLLSRANEEIIAEFVLKP